MLALITIYASTCFAQMDSTKNPLTFSGYLETYYAYDFSNSSNHIRPNFVYSFNRHNEVSLNLGFVKANYQTSKVRANLALMAGTYSNANLADETGVIKNVLEANTGIKISKKQNLWLDAGIFASHIGFESAIGKDCWNLTRSILADNSPYFESGIKVSFTSKNEKWLFSGLFLNGWQRIQRVDGNNSPAFGHQITYKPNSRITLNSSSFVGNDLPDITKQMRYFHNFYSQFQFHKKFGLMIGFDIGFQQKIKASSEYNKWYSPVIIARFSPTNKLNIASRAEYYSDADEVIISTFTPNGFQTYGYSINFDYSLSSNMVWRSEGKAFISNDAVFILDKKASKQNYLITTSFAVSF